MKKILTTAIIILFAASVNAQTGMPKELTCTEKAFNFSFSVGPGWKFITPKMGPVEVTNNGPGYLPPWYLKNNNVMPETQVLLLVEKPLSVEGFSYPIIPQNYAPLDYYNSFGVMDKPKYLLPGINLGPSIIYKALRPSFLVNSIPYSP